MKKNYLLFVVMYFLLLIPISVSAQSVCMVKDIHPTQHSNPESLIDVNGTLFFAANNGPNNIELWKSDGTEAGTVLVKEISPAGSSYPTYLMNVSGTLYFLANDGVHGRELWKSDGTEAGTVLVKDIYPGSSSGSLVNFANVNGTLYFAAESTSSTGLELWKSDGTEAGTVMVKDIFPGNGDGHPASMTNYNGTLYFSADDGVNGKELWKSDGTSAGTVMVKDINPTGSSYPSFLTDINGTLFFSANDGVNGGELWKSDGTTGGTMLVKDVNPGGDGSPFYLTDVNGTLFFRADDGTHGEELWKSDGTDAGTMLVKDINTGSNSSSIGNLYEFQGSLFFSATNDALANGIELWKSDGTDAGTTIIKEINSSGSSSPKNLTALNDVLYFSATNGSNGVELWKTDGTSLGTFMVKDIYPGAILNSSSPDNFEVFNGSIFFAALEGSTGRELRSMTPAPSSSSINIVFSNINLTSMTLNWTIGDGSRRIVVAKSGSAVDAQPQNGTLYSADAAFGAGSELGTGNYVIFDGTGNSVTIIGLANSTTYHFAVYEYNQSACVSYLTTSHATGQETTLTTTSISDHIYKDKSLIIYPNPSNANSQIYIDSPLKILSASIYTMQGNFIKAVSINNTELEGLSPLEAGSYMLLVNTEKGSIVRKIVLN